MDETCNNRINYASVIKSLKSEVDGKRRVRRGRTHE